MLWVNLIMDTFASLALATNPPDRGSAAGEALRTQHAPHLPLHDEEHRGPGFLPTCPHLYKDL